MPSPVGHACAGIAAGWLCRGLGGSRGGRGLFGRGLFGRGLRGYRGSDEAAAAADAGVWKPALVFTVVGMLPDIDLLFGAHSGPTHGVGAALIVAGAALGLTRSWRWAGAVGAAYASHILLDWLGTDTKAPIGIMALWPLTRDYYESSLHVFMGVSRQIHHPDFWSYNLRALLRELIVLIPILVAVGVLRARRADGDRPHTKTRRSRSNPG